MQAHAVDRGDEGIAEGLGVDLGPEDAGGLPLPQHAPHHRAEPGGGLTQGRAGLHAMPLGAAPEVEEQAVQVEVVDQRHADALPDHLPQGPLRVRREACSGRQGFQGLPQDRQDQGREEVLLAPEVLVEGPLAGPCHGGHVRHPRGGVTPLGKDLSGRGQNGPAALQLARTFDHMRHSRTDRSVLE